MDRRRVIVDTDTAGDDSQALVLALRSSRLGVEGITVVAGNVAFDAQVENAKYTLQVVERTEVPVYEGAERPLLKDWEHADYVHGEGGLGGDLFPDTGIESADEDAVEYILRTVRESPGEVSLLCLGPLTNVALAAAREPDLADLVDEVWVMGGAVNCLGNVTPAAEFNFWVDPDAAKRVCRDLDVHVVDWGVTLRDGVIGGDAAERAAALGTPAGEFFARIAEPAREFTEDEQGVDGIAQPDGLAAACMAAPEIRESVGGYHLDVDEREGLTRGTASSTRTASSTGRRTPASSNRSTPTPSRRCSSPRSPATRRSRSCPDRRARATFSVSSISRSPTRRWFIRRRRAHPV